MMQRAVWAVAAAFVGGMAQGQAGQTPQGVQFTPGPVMRTTPMPVMRTSPSSRVGYQRTISRYPTVYPSYGYGHGSYGWPYGYSSTGISVNGDGFYLNISGQAATHLAFGHAYGGTSCFPVQNGAEAVASLPEGLRGSVRVLYGADYGWPYDVLCFPGGYTYYPYSYRRTGSAHGWTTNGYVLEGGRTGVVETAGWGTMGQPATSQQPAPPPEPLTAIELARLSLAFGELEAAATHYRTHILENTEDSDALREYGLVMLESGKLADGFAAVRKAYRDKPGLAALPLDLDAMGIDGARVRKIMSRVSPEASKVQTSSAWLSVAVLLQWQDKPRAALRMLERSIEQGLEPEIADALKQQIKG